MATNNSPTNNSITCMEDAERALLKKCKLDLKTLKKLFSVLKSCRRSAENPDEFLEKFAKRCYCTDPTKMDDAISKARKFCQAAFGNVGRIFTNGAEEAFELRKAEIVQKHRAVAPHWEYEFGKYLVGHQLGVGGTAEVLLGLDTETNQEVAIKVYKTKYAHTAAKEGNILRKLIHPNIIRVHANFENCEWNKIRTTVMVMEYANRGELIEYLMYTHKFEAPLARWVLGGILSAVNYCHTQEPPIIHRDLKHDNCLFGEDNEGNFVVKINDFGFSRALADGQFMKTLLGTERYAAPEILRAKPYDGRVDIFALGVMLFVALSGAQPFKRADRSDSWYKYVTAGNWAKFWALHKRVPDAHAFSDEEKNLLEGMLAYNPDDRFTLKQIAEHKWMFGKHYDTATAKKQLTKRKISMDWMKYKKGQSASPVVSKDRAIEGIEELSAAPAYHTNIPSTGLWFYSSVHPSNIILGVKRVVEDDPFCGKTDYEKPMVIPEFDDGRKSSGSSQEISEEEENNSARRQSSGPKMKRLKQATSGMSALDAMTAGQYRLNFSLNANRKKQRGVVHIYSCPSMPDMNIVMFTPGVGSDSMLFPQIYSNLLDGAGKRGGVATLMANPERIQKKLLPLEARRKRRSSRSSSVSSVCHPSFE